MSIVVKNNIHWVGQRDWEVRDFHGTESVSYTHLTLPTIYSV